MEILKTPLYEQHVKLGARIVEFAGYHMPVQYSGLIAEHKAVRETAGLFDVSHMGEIEITGADAFINIQHLVTKDISEMQNNQVSYSPVCNEEGGVVDDILIYKKSDDKYLLVVNASNRKKDYEWITKHLFGNAKAYDISDDISQIALQGRNSQKILEKLTDIKYIPQKYYTFIDNAVVCGVNALVSRTGYTGEDGFEIYCANRDACLLWDKILEAGLEFSILPCGLGARDTLRLECAMPLYGHEMDDDVLPYEAGIGFFVAEHKEKFIGKDSLALKKATAKKRVGLKLLDRGIAREHTEVFADDKLIGVVTSGTHSPTLNYPVCMACIDKDYTTPGTILYLDVRGKKLKSEVVKLPFYKKNY